MYRRYRISLGLLRLISLKTVITRFRKRVLIKLKGMEIFGIHNLQREGIKCRPRIFSQIQYTFPSLLDIFRRREEIIYNKEQNGLDEIPTWIPDLSILSFHVFAGQVDPPVESLDLISKMIWNRQVNDFILSSVWSLSTINNQILTWYMLLGQFASQMFSL